jgi:class 3 adenylate cyclase/tetratricopeptide (TPR) repeat protein
MERKLATVLFVDLVDSTSLVGGADPEVVRRRVREYFDETASCIESHGGTVEKFAGDAVMAAFGVPRAHEDDAQRALRAAFAVLEKVHALGLEARIGVEAGEVVFDDTQASTFATGEAVNVAARLQQAAEPGEIVLGPVVRRLAAGSVEVEDAGPVEIKGRAEPIWTWRAVRSLDAPRGVAASWFIGREQELELLENALARTARDRRASVVTVYGEPGIGKTRLVTEFVEGVERATTLSGRALPYGEGITYWPLASMIKASAGIGDDAPAAEAFEKLRLCCESEAVADLLAVALGVLGAAEDGRTAGELTWAVTLWAEQLAQAQPLVLVFEDVHWAEDPLLDVVEHLARALRDSPVLIVCCARPDLLERRPSWGGGNPRAISLELGPLTPDQSRELVDALLAHADVPPAQRALALEKAEGNPLFLEETARVLADDEEAGALKRIPDSVQALIAARIDALDSDAKRVLQHAALIGRVFWRGALDALSPKLDVACALDKLLERELVTPEAHSSVANERAFRFTHGLIREVAYGTLTKAHRADDHLTLAAWVAERAPDELADIRAYHLDHAATLIAELEGAAPSELVVDAAGALDGAGRRALRRSSYAHARTLFLRAAELEPTVKRRYFAAQAAGRLSDNTTARDEVRSVLEDARAEGDRPVEGRALVLLADISLRADSDVACASRLAAEALETLPDDDEQGLYDAHTLLLTIAWWVGDEAAARRHGEAAVDLARAIERRDLESLALTHLASIASVTGAADQARELTTRATELALESGSREALGWAKGMVGRCAFAEDNPEEAEVGLLQALAMFEEIGAEGRAGWAKAMLAAVELRKGNLGRAEELARDAVRRLRAAKEHGFLVEAERTLAEVLVGQGRVTEAERVAEHARKTVGSDDVWSCASTLHALGLVRAAQGRQEEAESLLREALATVEPTMYKQFADDLRASLEKIAGRPAPAAASS